MKYEICKGVLNNGLQLWTTVAWTDVQAYAEQILTALDTTRSEMFAILCDGKIINQGNNNV